MTGPIDVFTTMPGYWPHLQPIFDALPEDRRGHVFVPSNMRPRIEHERVRIGTPGNSDAPLLVGGYQDLRYAVRGKVLVSHGAGQTYVNCDSPSYDGGPGREMVGLFICPNERSAIANTSRYPAARSVAVGCPKLDTWYQLPRPNDGTVGVTFHWPCRLRDANGGDVPESGWAFDSWRDQVADLTRSHRVLGHAHPRARQLLENFWASLGVEAEWDARTFVGRCDVLVADNTSLLPEAAAAGRSLVWLNDVTWRRDAEHGGRFFEWPRGQVQCWPGDDLANAVDTALIDSAGAKESRARMVATVYGEMDGGATRRAVDAILLWEAETARLA